MVESKPSHRNSLVECEAEILAHEHHAGGQHTLRLHAPEVAEKAVAGSFVHLRCDPDLPLRRPLSIMLRNRLEGTIDLLYNAVGRGTAALVTQPVGACLPLLGPIGNGFTIDPSRPRPLLLGGGVGMPPMLFLAGEMRALKSFQPVVFLGSEQPFPFTPQPSAFLLDALPPEVLATMPLLDDWGIPARLASGQEMAGCYQGRVTELAHRWLQGLDQQSRQQLHIYACGPTPMLQAVTKLAREFELPCQISLEEYMACAVGGCAGCVVSVTTPAGPVMKRVCVDGPVFDATAIF